MNTFTTRLSKLSFFALISILLFSTSCDLFRGPDPEPDPDDTKANVEDLAGTWVRVLSNAAINDGMQVTVTGNQGVVTDPATGQFSQGSIKWKDITGSTVTDDEFEHEELGSDGNYYPATMFVDGDTLRVTVLNAGSGNIQRWVISDKYTEPAATTTVLSCDDITSATTLTNSEAAVDYRVPSGCVLDVSAALTIEPGTVIEFEENSGIGVFDNGSINAVGTAAQPIIMRGLDNTPGTWRGLHIETNSLNNQFDYVTVEGAGSNYVYCCNVSASVFLKGGRMSIKNSTLANGASYGLYANGAAILENFVNNSITTHSDYPLYLDIERLGELDGMGSDFTGNTKDLAFVLHSDMDKEGSIPKLNVPYLMEGEVFDIREALTIESGIEMKFEANGGLGVIGNGSLKITGTAGEPVKIGGEQAVEGFWRGIHIETNSINNDFNYVQISDAGSDYVYCCNTEATLYLKDGKLALKNSTISNGNGYGIATQSDFTFGDFAKNTITTHKKEPLYVTAVQIGQLDGLGSDFSGNDEDYLLIYRDRLSEEATWKETNVPYLVESNTVIDIVEPITFEPGVSVKFEANAGMGVFDNGTFKAIGTAAKGISFTGKEDVSGYWRGIHSETNSTNNVLEYVTISNPGSNYVYCCNPAAGLFLRDGTMDVKNSTFTKSGGCGIFVRSNATLTESNLTFSENVEGDICN